jgi:hypothetical protein
MKGDDRDLKIIQNDLESGDEALRREASAIVRKRRDLGLEGLVGGLQAVIINVEPELHEATMEELLRYSGLEFQGAYQDDHYRTCVLQVPVQIRAQFRCADFLIRSRHGVKNPFLDLNYAPKTRHLPNTRLETFVFEVIDLERYVSIQKMNGTKFITNDILDYGSYYFIQTAPSSYTGNSLGFLQWKNERGNYASSRGQSLQWFAKKPPYPHLKNIGCLDHAAARIKAQHRDAAILEFMRLTNYNFDFAIYVHSLNSITSVARLSSSDFAMVFTSGISPDLDDGSSGPTEKFIRNYGSRVHHIAFQTEKIEETYHALHDDEMKFLIELVGSPDEGLKQTFTLPSENTLLVTEYIHRYSDFQGFFTRSNVTLLTAATDKQ